MKLGAKGFVIKDNITTEGLIEKIEGTLSDL
jgi:hypothetical protein